MTESKGQKPKGQHNSNKLLQLSGLMKSDQPNHQRQQRRQRKGWQFTFFGETTPKKEKQQEKINQKSINSCFPLGVATVGESLWIVGMESKEASNRLLAMGLIPGTELKVVSSTPSGSVIVAVKNNRIGLNAGMAQNILVSTEPFNLPGETENNSNHITIADLQD